MEISFVRDGSWRWLASCHYLIYYLFKLVFEARNQCVQTIKSCVCIPPFSLPRAVAGLTRTFRLLDMSQSQSLDIDEFNEGLAKCGLHVSSSVSTRFG